MSILNKSVRRYIFRSPTRFWINDLYGDVSPDSPFIHKNMHLRIKFWKNMMSYKFALKNISKNSKIHLQVLKTLVIFHSSGASPAITYTSTFKWVSLRSKVLLWFKYSHENAIQKDFIDES